jgi:hypothetical protein
MKTLCLVRICAAVGRRCVGEIAKGGGKKGGRRGGRAVLASDDADSRGQVRHVGRGRGLFAGADGGRAAAAAAAAPPVGASRARRRRRRRRRRRPPAASRGAVVAHQARRPEPGARSGGSRARREARAGSRDASDAFAAAAGAPPTLSGRPTPDTGTPAGHTVASRHGQGTLPSGSSRGAPPSHGHSPPCRPASRAPTAGSPSLNRRGSGVRRSVEGPRVGARRGTPAVWERVLDAARERPPRGRPPPRRHRRASSSAHGPRRRHRPRSRPGRAPQAPAAAARPSPPSPRASRAPTFLAPTRGHAHCRAGGRGGRRGGRRAASALAANRMAKCGVPPRRGRRPAQPGLAWRC